jgi:hypothetical protein
MLPKLLLLQLLLLALRRMKVAPTSLQQQGRVRCALSWP